MKHKYRYTTRQAAECAASELQVMRDYTSVALNAVLNGTMQYVDGHFGDEGAYYTFGCVPRVCGCIVLVTFHCPRTGQADHTACYPEDWVRDEIGRMVIVSADDKERIRYRDGLYALSRLMHSLNESPA